MKIDSKMKRGLLILGLALATTGSYAGNVRHVLWNKNFIPLQVPIGKEKIIEVCAPSTDPAACQTASFTPYLPQEVVSKGQLKWIHANGSLYLNAKHAFSNQLVALKLNDKNGDMILISLSASEQANDDRIEILLPSQQSNDNADHPTGNVQEDKSIGAMVRWVAQQLYAPQRLLTQPNWIYRVPMHTERFIPLYRGGVVSSMPLASWRAGDYYITAVLLRNVLRGQKVRLHYSLLRGRWIAASFFRQSRLRPSVLTPARTLKDSTTAILVSTVPFRAALQEGSSDA